MKVFVNRWCCLQQLTANSSLAFRPKFDATSSFLSVVCGESGGATLCVDVLYTHTLILMTAFSATRTFVLVKWAKAKR